MFAQLYRRQSAIARHLSAPYVQERSRYLAHCVAQGYSRVTVLFKSRELLWVARKLSVYGDLRLTLPQIEAAAQEWHEREHSCGRPLNRRWTRLRFIDVARSWLRFLGLLSHSGPPIPFAEYLEAYGRWMAQERGCAPTTIRVQRECIARFLRWYGPRQRPFTALRLADVDAYLAEAVRTGLKRASVRNIAVALRAFCRFGGARGWCSSQLADGIGAPRLYTDEGLPLGVDWPTVQRLLRHTATDRPADVRDLAILMLLAIYGLRASEVVQLQLQDFSWEQDLLRVSRAKGRGFQVFPLVPSVGNAVARYLQEVRPPTAGPQVFLTLLPPLRPVSRSAVYSLTRKHLTEVGARCAHLGPHALRHACATHLLAQGFSLKAIGDHLGHRCTAATRIYAKVDLPGLREVAAFDMGGLSCS